MIDKILPLALTALGATMMTKKGGLLIVSSSYLDFEPTDFVVDHVKASEGLRENAYYATIKEKAAGQYTIGYGTSFLFYGDGRPFDNGYGYNKYAKGLNGVRSNDTLSSLKVKMGYSGLSNSDFAMQLIKNHIKGGSYSKIAKDLDARGVSYTPEVAEFLAEFAYGSSSAFNPNTTRYTDFMRVLLSSSDKISLARACAIFRLGYYTPQDAWQNMGVRYSWSRRVYGMAMHIKGIDIDDVQIQKQVTTKNATGNRGNWRVELQNLSSLFRTELGVIVNL
ncbi:hypothetical protein KRE28_06130 [Elizabethkingia meningoseptica]|uniref:hypothetical protein n=1 Tax=Elizabethkingia meningoseptica TaxID=238 RepID=UPI0023B12B07|nr:hypothetical protein [Elizabethkingia meningoseptica]MDE5481395.1 hypothetical protein [Elizabethkingia meningoseptica]